MDSDRQSDLGPHCLFMRLQIFQWTTKHTVYDYVLKGL